MNIQSPLTYGRNPTMQIAGLTVKIMGDPHLGRRFITGVPLHRAGEREREILGLFEQNLFGECNLHVCMGDLFDKAVVPLDIIKAAADCYRRAAAIRPDTIFVVIKGNHDAGEDEERTTAFQIFRELMAPVENVNVTSDDNVLWSVGPTGPLLAFVPWSRNKTSAEMVEMIDKADAVFGHWDIHSFGNDRNLVPTEALTGVTPLVITGHDHTPAAFERHGVSVIGTGSLQPFTHGEDPVGEIYRTMGLDDALALDAEERKTLCLRLVVNHDEVVPPASELNCRQLDVVRRDPNAPLVEALDLGALDMKAIWDAAMTEAGVEPDTAQRLFRMYQNREIPK